MNKEQREFYNWLPDEFWAKHDQGIRCEFTPSIDWHELSMAMHDSDDDTWSKMFMSKNYVTENGRIVIEVVNHYECGDTEVFQTVPIGDNPAEVEDAIWREYERKVDESIVRYLEWVIDRESDPLEYFPLRPLNRVQRTYRVHLQREGGKVRWVGWMRKSGKHWRDPYWAPFYLHDFVSARMDGKKFYARFIEWEDIADPDCDEIWITQELTEQVPNRHYQRKLVFHARFELQQIKERMK